MYDEVREAGVVALQPEEWYLALMNLYEDDEMRSRMREKALEYAEEISIERRAEQWREAFDHFTR